MKQNTGHLGANRNDIPPPLHHAMRNHFRGEWSCENYVRGLYATDASNYQEWPTAVVWPKDDSEAVQLVKIAGAHGVPITARGAGTSLAGQAIGSGIVVDFSRYMNRVLELNFHEKWARVEPGVVRDQLNDVLKVHGLHFAPDPATTSRATIGGMIANNSSGTRSIIYGKTIDHLIAVKVLLSSGEIIWLGNSGIPVHWGDFNEADRDRLTQQLGELIGEHREAIERVFPKVMRRVGGYPLDYLTNPEGANFAKLFCGSEGTLGLILEATVSLTPLPASQSTAVLHFDSALGALAHVGEVLEWAPSAVELVDGPVLTLGRQNRDVKALMADIDERAGGLLLVEFSGEKRDDVRQKATALVANFHENGYRHAAMVAGENERYSFPWELRKKGLGILMGTKEARKPVAFVEDSCVRVNDLNEYIRDVLEICRAEGAEAIIYAHASVGVIHVRPLLDLSSVDDIEAMQRISEKVFERVIHYGGSWSGEHGDGYARSYKNKEFFGEEVYAVFEQIKAMMDPDGIFNPGKIVNAPKMTEHLRLGGGYRVSDLPGEQDFNNEAASGFVENVHMCSGVGECVKRKIGVMCPSYRATGDEGESTRGRANGLRLAMSGQLPDGLLAGDLWSSMDTCLSCKACKSECPSNVDMARLKSQLAQWRHRALGMSWTTRAIVNQPALARRFSGISAVLVNQIMRFGPVSYLVKSILQLDTKRNLPAISTRPFHRIKRKKFIDKSAFRLVLFADTYAAFHEDKIARSAYKLLCRMGFDVDLYSSGCCQRPAISSGALDFAKEKGGRMSEELYRFAAGDPVVMLEPSCASAVKDDLPDLLSDNKICSFLKNQVYLLEDFLVQYSAQAPVQNFKLKLAGKHIIHGHCHHKAIWGMDGMKHWFASHVEGDYHWLDSGCCGLAGAFGYEKRHSELSKEIAHQSLSSAMRAWPRRTVIATGFSCRHQIRDVFRVEAKHWLEYADL